MPLPFELALALRYLRPKRTFVSIITLICIAGVTLGVAVLIIVISVMTGFDRQLREQLIGFSAHLRVEQRGHALQDWASVAKTISADSRVRAVAPYLDVPVLVETEGLSFGSIIRGIDPALEARANSVTNRVLEGDGRLTPKTVLMGYALADAKGIRVGDHITVYSAAAFSNLKASRDRAKAAGRSELDEVELAEDYRVRGLMDFGLNDLNANLIVTSLPDAQDLSGHGEGVQGLKVMLRDPDERQTLKMQQSLGKELGPAYSVPTWMDESRDFLNALSTEKTVMFFILFFIVIVAAFGIMSALITFVVQKTREIGMLKALGASPASVAGLFLAQSLIVGVLGVASGFLLGMLAIAYRNEFLATMNRLTGFNLFPPSIYQFRELPAQIVPSDVWIICSISLLSCLIAGLIPAIRAAWLQPVEALRHE
jgi:lipoprotein-releasing system permease protein